MKPILIKQSKGLGDIFFCQKIGLILKKSNSVIWPVIKKYLYIKDYLPDIEYCNLEESFAFKDEYNYAQKGKITEFDSCIVVSTDGCPESENNGVMVSKYNLLNLAYNDWLSFFNFKRDTNRENELFNKLNPTNEPYIFINKNIGGPGDESSWNFDVPTDKKIIELREYEDYNIFDWCKILENASEFYIMETCISYLIEKLNTNCTQYKMYHRSPSTSPNYKEFLSIYSKPVEHVGSEKIVKLQN